MPDDLVLQPDFAFEDKTTFNTLVTEFENGVEQRRAKWATPIKSWKFVYKNRTASELSTLQTLFENKKGRYSSWTWTNPVDSQTYTVRFDTDELLVMLKAYGIYDIEFTVKEVK